MFPVKSMHQARYFRIIRWVLLLPLVLSPLHSRSTEISDPQAMLRAGRWREIVEYFDQHPPYRKKDRYAYASAMAEAAVIRISPALPISGEALKVIREYLHIVNLDCPGNMEVSINDCVSRKGNDTVDDFLEKLSIWKLAGFLRKTPYRALRLKTLSLADLSDPDPLSESIFCDRLALLQEIPNIAALQELTDRYPSLKGPHSLSCRAGAMLRTGPRDAALRMYFLAASETLDDQLIRSIYSEVKRSFPEVFLPAAIANTSYNRRLSLFSSFLTSAELNGLRQSVSAQAVVASSNSKSVYTDGIFLIRTDQSAHLDTLSASLYTYLSQQPSILYTWADYLFRARQYEDARKLFARFAHVKRQHFGFWKLHLDLLARFPDKKAYFQEIVEYLKVFHSDYSINDRLIESLIGTGGRISWADAEFWEYAKNNLPPLTAKGRFVYWLKRYYQAKNQNEAAEEISKKFYASAPGSFYARAFWDERQPEDFARSWRSVHDRSSYLEWISANGGSAQALRFLTTKNVSTFLDPQAAALWRRINDSNYRIPIELLELYELGEFNLGQEFFKVEYFQKVSNQEYQARMMQLGRRTGNLNLSVYYTRQLIREQNIAEDPFSLPPAMLKALYPRPYLNVVNQSASSNGIEPEMIYSLMRQESLFREGAVSRSGALGLMQIMPATGRELARALRLGSPNLKDPEISISMGARFFADLMRANGSDFRWASIAYNGGPGNLRRWKQLHYTGDLYMFLENLPKAESRDYCRVTYQNYQHYRTTYMLYPE